MTVSINLISYTNVPVAAEVAQWVRAFAPQAEGWELESPPRQT